MAMKKKSVFGEVHPSIIAVWAALIAASHFLPGIPLFGIGGTMSVSAVLLPLTGIFFGPVAGGLCGGIGQFIGYLIEPSAAWAGMFTWLLDVITPVISGCLAFGFGKGSKGKVRPFVALGLTALAFIGWFTHPIGQAAPIYAFIFGGYGLVCVIIGIFFAKRFLLSKNVILKAIAVFVCSAAGMIIMSVLSGVVNFYVFATPADVWKMLATLAPIERSMFSAAAMLIGVPLLMGLPKIGVPAGPMAEAEADDDSDDEEVV